MIYSDPEFFILLASTLTFFYLIRNRSLRLGILIAASLAFYVWAGAGDALIFFFVLIVAWLASFLAKRFPTREKLFVALGITIMALHLFLWKYASWFSCEVQSVFPSFLGGRPLDLPLPIGISFFTLQGIAYLVDLRRGEASFVGFEEFVLFKSFFPQLVAGPIVRAKELIPQIRTLAGARVSDIQEGIFLFFIGFAKKLLFADPCGIYADPIFNFPQSYDRSTLIKAVLAYTVQIWADFSGYTDMGRGAALLFGIRLPENFLSPYLSRSPSEFWQRWHITLSRWIRDYIYIPLGGRKGSLLRASVVALATMAISGLWHGANWTFVLWGVYHGVLLLLARVLGDGERAVSARSIAGLFRSGVAWGATFVGVMTGWSLFRSKDLSAWLTLLHGLIHSYGLHESLPPLIKWALIFCVVHHLVFYFDFSTRRAPILDWLSKLRERAVQSISWSRLQVGLAGLACGTAIFGFLLYCILNRVTMGARPFIYFQF